MSRTPIPALRLVADSTWIWLHRHQLRNPACHGADECPDRARIRQVFDAATAELAAHVNAGQEG